MDSVTARIRRSLAQRGFVATAQLSFETLLQLFLPEAREREAQRKDIDAAFDRENGVETGGIFRPRADAVIGNNWSLGLRYQPVVPSDFLATLRSIPIAHSDFTFVDFGSGKGRAILLASEFPFRKVIGVEYCPELNAIARRNWRRYPVAARKCEQLEIVEEDATRFSLPDGSLVLFFFNPFAEAIMARVAENVAESFHRNPRRIVVIYFTPDFAHVWEATGFLRRVQALPAVFDSGDV